MPPKAVKKPGDEADFSDLATLPPANIFKFSIILKTFFSQENRDKVTKRITDNLVPTSNDKIKMITREDIMTAGKTKGTILDTAGIQALSPEDPRRQLTEEEMFARAAADRLFEMSVLIRRAKKEKIAKMEEEAANKAGDEGTATTVLPESDSVDAMFYLVDYPQTKSEAFAFASCSYALNGVFEVNEVPKADAEDAEDEDEEKGSDEDEDEDEDKASADGKKDAVAEEQKVEMTPDSDETQKLMQTMIEQLMISRSLSSANSTLRQMAFMKVNFRDEAKTMETKDAEGQTVKKDKASEDVFLTDLYQFNIDKFAQYFVQYLKFRELVTVEPLMPDKEAMSSIRQLEKSGELLQASLEEQEAAIEEEINNLKEEANQKED